MWLEHREGEEARLRFGLYHAVVPGEKFCYVMPADACETLARTVFARFCARVRAPA
jgi:hypothetical protein